MQIAADAPDRASVRPVVLRGDRRLRRHSIRERRCDLHAPRALPGEQDAGVELRSPGVSVPVVAGRKPQQDRRRGADATVEHGVAPRIEACSASNAAADRCMSNEIRLCRFTVGDS